MSYDGGGGRVITMPQMPGWMKRISGTSILILMLVVWMVSGVYQVDQGEVGVVRTFGAVTGTVGTGLHWHWPWPIEQVTVLSVDQIRRVEIGARTPAGRPNLEETQMLTGDENILHAELVVQYRVSDPVKYLFILDNPTVTVRDVAQAVLRQVVGSRQIDEVLTVGKLEVQVEVLNGMQAILDRYNAGISIQNVNLQDVFVPDPVTGAFKDVVSAREEAVRMINEAEAYRNDILPRARGESERILREAEAYRAERVAHAQGDANKFLAMLQEYEKGKTATRIRLYLEAMEAVLPHVEIWILDDKGGTGVIPFLPLIREGR
jgi:modulator of FtsH protease HflK